MKEPVIKYSEEGILFCDDLPCDMYDDCNMRCDICPVDGDHLIYFAGMDGLSPITEDSTKKCLASLHSDMLHSKTLK